MSQVMNSSLHPPPNPAMSTRKLRLLQWDDWYPAHLDALYMANPRLGIAAPRVQEKALIRDGFSAIHVMAPYLPEMEGIYCVGNCRPQVQAWMRFLGLPMLASTGDWEAEALRRMVGILRPDVLYIANPIHFSANFLRTLPYTPRLIMAWRAADVPLGTDWTGYDVMLSALPRMLALATSLGARASELFYPGMPDWIAQAVKDVPKNTDVVFAGSLSPSQHARRFHLLNMLAESALDKGFSLALHLACAPGGLTPAMRHFWRPPVFGLEMHKALARGRIVIDCQGGIGVMGPDGRRLIDLAAGDTANMRLWEATACGSLLLTEAFPGLSRIFEPDKEVAVYMDDAQCLEKLYYYLEHPEACEHVAEEGRRRCLGAWNMRHQAARFHRIITQRLAGVCAPGLPAEETDGLS